MKQFISGATIANDLRMRRATYAGAYLLVEGDSDYRLFAVYVNPATCQIVICFGRERLFEAISILDAAVFSGAVCIADADFERIDQVILISQNVVYTDLHDLECLMLSGSAFDRILNELATEERLTQWKRAHVADIRQRILETAVEIGYLLWHSRKSALNLTLSELDTKEFVHRDSLLIDATKLSQHVINKSGRHDLRPADLVSGIHDRKQESNDLWQICRGHDFASVLGFALKHALGTRRANEVTVDQIELYLRLAYPVDEFKTSTVYAGVKDWERRNPPFEILAV